MGVPAAVSADQQQFAWTSFYEAIAEKLLAYAENRGPLVELLSEIARETGSLGYLKDRFADGSSGFPRDICPFTTMGTFNRGETDGNRQILADQLARRLGVGLSAPSLFGGIPTLDNRRSWFFGFATVRKATDIDVLWKVFVAANEFAAHDAPNTRAALAKAYDEALQVSGVRWILSFGLFWAHPWCFPSLSRKARPYISLRLGIEVPGSRSSQACDGVSYLRLRDAMAAKFREKESPVRSFPAVGLAAWNDPHLEEKPELLLGHPAEELGQEESAASPEDTDPRRPDPPEPYTAPKPYTIEDLLKDGCFQERSEIGQWLKRLRDEKNLILQGPPGTGKTWLAKRLAYVVIGRKDDSRVRSVQFHPGMSYEDFVRGWRPGGDGKLSLIDGLFLQAIHTARSDVTIPYVVVIEEINRGNPAQIFGELLTLLEADKRTPDCALELTYPDPKDPDERVFLPENLYVIGTMNLADRSLALMDFALRRRFVFGTLSPRFGPQWRAWIVDHCGVGVSLAAEIEVGLKKLNQQIADDKNLGRQFCIGHSYVTPHSPLESERAAEWFLDVVETEIRPLLEEYWFDDPSKARKAADDLRQRSS